MFAELALYFAEIREAFEAVDKTLSEKVPGGISRFIFPPPAFSPDEKKSAPAGKEPKPAKSLRLRSANGLT